MSHELAQHTRVDLRGDTLTVATPDGASRLFRRSGNVRIQIRVPYDSAARIRSASAGTTCHGRFARLTVDSASGDVHIEHVTGHATFRMASGDVRVDRVDGQLQVNGASGDVTAQQAGGPVEVSLASGDIDVHRVG